MTAMTSVLIVASVMMVAAAAAARTSQQPAGYLVAMLAPDHAQLNNYQPYAIDPWTGDNKEINTQALSVNMSRTLNGGAYNPVTKQLQFMGNVTGSSGAPSGQRLISVDITTGAYSFGRAVSWNNAEMFGVRVNPANGVIYGMSEIIPSWTSNSVLCIVNTNNGTCTPVMVTDSETSTYVTGNMALGGGWLYTIASDQTATRNLVALYSQSLTNSTHRKVIIDGLHFVDYHTVCYDATTDALYSLQRVIPPFPDPPQKYKSGVMRVDPVTGDMNLLVPLVEETTVGTCYGGYFFALSTETDLGDFLLYTVDLTTGEMNWNPLSFAAIPSVLAFVPQ